MRLCEINFGGEIGTRPAAIIKNCGNNLEVVKITTKSKLADTYKVRLSGLSKVKGYAVANYVYTVPKTKVKHYSNTLFDCETRAIYSKLNSLKRQNKVEYITIK